MSGGVALGLGLGRHLAHANGAVGGGDRDVAPGEGVPDAFARAAVDAVAQMKARRVKAHPVLDVAVDERVEHDGRRRIGEHAVGPGEGVEDRGAHVVRWHVGGHLDVERAPRCRGGLREVGDRRLREYRVGHDDLDIVERDHLGRAPVDLEHAADVFRIGVELDPVLDVERPLRLDRETGDEVAERLL